jgi:hypothetical protein
LLIVAWREAKHKFVRVCEYQDQTLIGFQTSSVISKVVLTANKKMFLQLHGHGVVSSLHYFGAQVLPNADEISSNISPTAMGENDIVAPANEHYVSRIRDQSRNI